MDKELLEFINTASDEELLRRWRFAPAGDPIFIGKAGEAYVKAMKKLQATKGFSTISKRVGWEQPQRE